ncbi:hypothetical protein DFH09DRAFT_1473575 [Mycena vulgaris]|nr:hypothetical protein DFH09DRAFT_1473575 [Mycena vulgaris]
MESHSLSMQGTVEISRRGAVGNSRCGALKPNRAVVQASQLRIQERNRTRIRIVPTRKVVEGQYGQKSGSRRGQGTGTERYIVWRAADVGTATRSVAHTFHEHPEFSAQSPVCCQSRSVATKKEPSGPAGPRTPENKQGGAAASHPSMARGHPSVAHPSIDALARAWSEGAHAHRRHLVWRQRLCWLVLGTASPLGFVLRARFGLQWQSTPGWAIISPSHRRRENNTQEPEENSDATRYRRQYDAGTGRHSGVVDPPYPYSYSRLISAHLDGEGHLRISREKELGSRRRRRRAESAGRVRFALADGVCGGVKRGGIPKGRVSDSAWPKKEFRVGFALWKKEQPVPPQVRGRVILRSFPRETSIGALCV